MFLNKDFWALLCKNDAMMISNAILLANDSMPLSYRIVDVKEYKKASLLFYEINNVSYFKKYLLSNLKTL